MPADDEEREGDRRGRGDHQPEREDDPARADQPGRAAEQPRHGGGRWLPEFIGRLRDAGLDPSPESVAEALWLARWVASGGGGDVQGAGAEAPDPALPGGGTSAGPAPVFAGEEETEADAAEGGAGHAPRPGRAPGRSPTVSLYAPERDSGTPGNAFAVRAPAVGTLPGLLGLQRAMRPLLGYRSRLPSGSGRLDETATADLSARSGSVRPVFGRAERRETEVQLLMDASATTSIWQLTFDSLRQTCEQLGAFRDVSARYLHRAPDGTPMIGTGADRETTRLRPAHQYRDTTGRRLTLIVSDCVGPLWQDGGAQRLLYSWSAGSPLAVVQPLPPRMWPRTALPAQPGLLVRDRDSGGRLSFSPDGFGTAPEKDAVPVPVLLPTPAALGSWARLLGGGGRGTARGAAAWVRPRHSAAPRPRVTVSGGEPGEPAGSSREAPRPEDARELLDAFRATASAGALDLVVHLAPVPLLLPVIHLVQTAILPDTGPTELAEVLLSGLLERLPDIEGSPGPRYEFKPGVRDLLMQSLDRGAIVLLLKHVSDYVERRFGKVSHNFPAMAVERLSGRGTQGEAAGPWREPGQPWDDVTDDLFAQIPARVIRWYEPWEPVPSGLEGAERLLRRWWEQGDPQLLRQARTHAEEAVREAGGEEDRAGETGAGGAGAGLAGTGLAGAGRTGVGAPDVDAPGQDRTHADGAGGAGTVDAPGAAGAPSPLVCARLVLGRVLHALTDTGEVRRDPARARALLRAAARQLTAPDRDTRFELAAVLLDLWQSERDGDHLRDAARTLRAMAGEAAEAGRPLPEAAEARRRLWLGRVLLAGASAEGRTEGERHSDAGRAVTELRSAAELLTAQGDNDSQLCAVLLDLSGALRLSGAPSPVRLANLERARTAAGDDDALRRRCARERARVNRDDGDAVAADLAYAEAEEFTAGEGLERCELLTEWGTMLLDDTEEITRAEGLLREALTRAPSDGPLPARLQLLLGRALVARYHGGGFLPDLYEACHLLEQSARRAQGPGTRAEAWLRLGSARLDFPEGHLTNPNAGEALSRSLAAAREARGEAPASAAVARALHAGARLAERQGDLADALTGYRAAAAEWRRLAGHFPDEAPWDEMRLTRERIAALEAG
jgi:hypothetical protein